MDENEIINLDQYTAESVVRRYAVKGTLRNIHGEHQRRTQKISMDVIKQDDLTTESIESSKKEKTKDIERLKKIAKKREKFEEIHTFPTDDNNNLLVPLGGPRGYIMGALKGAIADLFKDKVNDKTWEGHGIKTYIEHGVFIKPSWIPVGKVFSNAEEKPVGHGVTIKRSGSRVTTYYDVVEHADFELTIEMTNPKIPEHIFFQLLGHIQRLGIGPKGRGSLVFTEVRRA